MKKLLLMALLTAVVPAGCKKGGGGGEEPPAPTKTVSVAAQQGAITEGEEGVATFAVTTAYIDDGKTGAVTWYTTTEGTATATPPAGITPSVTDVASGAATVTMTAATTAQEGSYYFKVTIDGAVSGVQTLSVGEPAAVPEWPTYERLVKTITVAEDYDSDGTAEDEFSVAFTYDDKQRVTSISNDAGAITVGYSGNIVTLTVEGMTLMTLTLDLRGCVTKKTMGDDSTYAYEYSGGYIAKETRSSGTVLNYVWSGGNMTENSTDTYTHTYTYLTDREDKLNLCLTEPDIVNALYLKFPGVCSKNFIETSPAYDPSLPADTWTYTWDADGWPVRITEQGIERMPPTTTYYTVTTDITYY